MSPVFRVAVINDEISQDFGHALEVASKEFGLGYVEIRGLWKKNVINLDEKETAEARLLLQKFGLLVTDIASPLFKTDWPGAPLSKESPRRDQFNADFDFKQQDVLLEHCIGLAKTFGTDVW